MVIKLTMIEFQLPITNQVLEVTLTEKYKKRNGNVMIYNIGVNMDVEKMQQKLMV